MVSYSQRILEKIEGVSVSIGRMEQHLKDINGDLKDQKKINREIEERVRNNETKLYMIAGGLTLLVTITTIYFQFFFQ